MLGATLTSFTRSARTPATTRRSTTPAQARATRWTSRRASCATSPTRPVAADHDDRARAARTTSSSRPPTRREWVRYCLTTAPASSATATAWETESALTASARRPADAGDLPGRRAAPGARLDRDARRRRPTCVNGAPAACSTTSCSPVPGTSRAARSRRRPPAHHQRQRRCTSTRHRARRPRELRVSTARLPAQPERAAGRGRSRSRPAARKVILNGSASTDPEGRTLAYDWFLGNGTDPLTPEEACAGDQAEGQRHYAVYLGQGTTYRYAVPTGVGLADDHPARRPRPGLPVRDQDQVGDDPMSPDPACPTARTAGSVVSAIVLMAIMLSVGLRRSRSSTRSQKRSRESRERESSLSLAEGVAVRPGLRADHELAERGQAARRRLLLGAALTATSSLPGPRHARQGQLGQRQRRAVRQRRPQRQRDLDDQGARQRRRARRRLRPDAGRQHPDRRSRRVHRSTPCRMDFNGDRQLWVSGRRRSSAASPRNVVARLQARAAARERPAGRRRRRRARRHQQPATSRWSTAPAARRRALRARVTSTQCIDYEPARAS